MAMNPGRWSAALLAGWCCSAPVYSLELGAVLQHTSEYTTNSALTSDDEVSEWIHQPGFQVGASQDTATLQLDANYQYQRLIYEKDLFSDEDILTGQASMLWTLLPDRLDFTASNRRTQATRRSISAANPDNLQVVGNTEIGPTLRLQPRSGDELLVEYRYLHESVDQGNEDSQRHNGTLSYLLGLSANRNLVFQTTYSDISYDDLEDATSITATAGYQQTGGALSFDFNAGYTDFDRDGRDSANGGVFNMGTEWRATGSTTWSARANRSIQDQSSSFTDDGDVGDPLPEDSDTNEAFVETRGEIGLRQAFGPSTNLSASVYYSDEDYEDVPRDSERIGITLGFDRALTRTTTFEASLDYSNRDYSQVDDTQDEVRARFRVAHRIGRALTFTWGASYEDRDADLGDSYDEFRYTLSLAYALRELP